MQLRFYQQAAIEAIHWYFQHAQGNPVIELPTGSGKSLIQAELIRGILEKSPGQRFLCLTHVKELIAQNYAELMGIWPNAPAGIYAASLNQRDTREPIIFASIQSVYQRAKELGSFDWVVIDECHLVPNSGSGIYRQFLRDMQEINPKLKVIGLSATPYRLSGGLLVEGKDRLFTDMISARKTGASVRRLIDANHLAPLVTPADRLPRLDTSNVRATSGEFNQSELSLSVEQQSQVTELACREILKRGAQRKKWIIFASSMAHCEQIQSLLDVPSMVVHGQLSRWERDAYIRQFRQGQLRALISINVLSTGFNVPDIDLLAMLRPTASASLYVQQAGRGMRTAPGKQNCLVLDFAGTIERHGPVDNIHTPQLMLTTGGERPMKECDECMMFVSALAKTCRFCGFEFPLAGCNKLTDRASQSPILDLEQHHARFESVRATYSVHQRPGQPDAIKIDYCEEEIYVGSDWIYPLDNGYVGLEAEKWFVEYCEHFGRFQSIVEALDVAEACAVPPEFIIVDENRAVPEVVSMGPATREPLMAWLEG
jgi:DNA repair protein RadD